MWPPVTTDGQPLRGSSCTLSRPSMNFLTNFLTIPSLMAFSLYTSHIWRRISDGFTFLALKKPYFTVGGALNHLEHFKCTEQYVNTICFSRIGVCSLPMNEGKQRACAKSRPQRCGGNVRKRYLLSEYASRARACVCMSNSTVSACPSQPIPKQERQCTYNVTLRSVPETIVAVEKQ